MTLLYATTAQLADWSGLPPTANATQLVRFASGLVRTATKTARYDVDADGAPTDTKVLEAFKDATCAQATLWQTAGINPAAGEIITTTPVTSKGIGSARISYDTSALGSAAALSARTMAATTLCYEAFLILQNAGLVGGAVARG